MTWWNVRRLLRDIERASDRWRLVEASRGDGTPSTGTILPSLRR